MDKLTRIGAPWTKEEEDAILAHVASGMRIAEIAITQKRTTGGIRARLTRLACSFVTEKKMSLYEAAGRTGLRVNRIEEALKRKTEEAKAKAECLNPKMEFKFQQTFTRAKLQGRVEEIRKATEAARLAQIRQNVEHHVNQIERAVLDEAATGKTFYLHELRVLPHDCTANDILQGFQQKFPECTVTLAEDWVDVPNRHPTQPPTRVLKSGIKIDWS